jgi:hypothetical protein
MNSETLDIDRIVREIVSRLRAELTEMGAEVTEQPTTVLTLAAQVVTMAEIRGKLKGVTQLKLEPRAIVTPSVRDELNDHKIEIVRD